MNSLLIVLEGWVRRRGIAIPRLYLLAVLGLLCGLVALMFLPSFRELLATVLLHDFFAVCALAIVAPLFLCDPVRARSPLWAAFHLACLTAAGLLAFFCLVCCDLLARDDRAFLFLLASVLGVLVGRLYFVDLAIAIAANTLSRSRAGRRLLLSTYARLLKVDPARVGLAPPALGPELRQVWWRHGSSLGVREQLQSRWALPRGSAAVQTPWGPVRVKRARRPDGSLLLKPEHDDLASIARREGLPLEDLRRQVLVLAQEQLP